MLFKKLIAFKLTEKIGLTARGLECVLQSIQFTPCTSHQYSSTGFYPPVESTGFMVHEAGGNLMFCVKHEEKLLPTTAVNELVKKKVDEAESEGHKLTRKGHNAVKDEVIFGLLPNALAKSSLTYGYIDAKQEFIFIEASSYNKAEEVLSLLRKTLGSLPCVPLNVKNNVVQSLTRWMSDVDQTDEALKFGLDHYCELRGEDSVIKCKNIDLLLPEVQHHIQDGKLCYKLGLYVLDRISFVISDDLSIKRIKFLGIVQDKIMEQEPDSAEHAFTVEMLIMCDELGAMMNDLIAAFGGLED